MIFLLREVYPYVNGWRFESELDRQRVITEVMKFFREILQLPMSNKDAARTVLRNTCVYALLNVDSDMTLLR